MTLPLITSAPHNSNDFAVFSDRVALTEWQRGEFSDQYTADTVFHPNALGNVVAPVSRGLGIFNRPRDLSHFFEEDFLGNPIWKEGHELLDDEKNYCLKTFYDHYYDEIKQPIKLSREKGFDKVILWDQHDTGDYDPKTGKCNRIMMDETRTMPKFILSNFGLEHTGETNPKVGFISCPSGFIQSVQKLVTDEFGIKTSDVEINTLYKGGNIIQHFGNPKNNFGNTVYAIQVEYNRGLIMNQETRKPYWDKIKDFNRKFNRIMENACELLSI